MASYFIAREAQADGSHAVHDRNRCPPGCFLAACEYLGEFLDARQAAIVARLRYPAAVRCTGGHAWPASYRGGNPALIPLRP